MATATVPTTIRDTEGLDGVSITQVGNNFTTTIESALTTSTDLAQAGAVFNDAIRLSDGGLWAGSTATEMASGSNEQPYLPMYVQDINAVSADVAAMLANPNAITVGGQAITDANLTTELQTIQGQLATLQHEAPLSVGTSAAAATAQGTIALTQQEILSEVNGDATLAQALNGAAYQSGTGFTNVGFQALPTGSDSAASIAAAEGSAATPPTLAQVGSVFNAAHDLALGGLNANNISEFNTDMQAVATGLQNIINSPTALAAIEANEQASAADGLTAQQEQALTTIHLQTALNQIELQINKFDGMYATNPNDAARSTNDNLLDIVDIVNNDAALATAAGDLSTANNPAQANQTFTASGAGGFGEMPGYLNGVGGVNDHGGTILQFQDNQAQTNFWSQFIAEANQLNNTLTGIANGTVQANASEIQSLITQINNYNAFGASFDASQGGVFGDRFDNELLGGTLKTDSANAVAGLQDIAANGLNATNAAQIVAAGFGFVADANDVSGNNLPTGGGAFVGTSTTVAGATTTGAATPGTAVPAGPVDGNDNPTTTPVNGLTNNGFGVTNPDPAAASTSTTSTTSTSSTGSDTGNTGSTGTDTGGHGGSMLSGVIAGDIASLVQALEGGQSSAISSAIATLTAAITGTNGTGSTSTTSTSGNTGSSSNHGSSGADTGGAGASDHGSHFGHDAGHHFEHMWH